MTTALTTLSSLLYRYQFNSVNSKLNYTKTKRGDNQKNKNEKYTHTHGTKKKLERQTMNKGSEGRHSIIYAVLKLGENAKEINKI